MPVDRKAADDSGQGHATARNVPGRDAGWAEGPGILGAIDRPPFESGSNNCSYHYIFRPKDDYSPQNRRAAARKKGGPGPCRQFGRKNEAALPSPIA
jgi:hypothetical protein